MNAPTITKEKVETLLDKKFLRVFDLKYEEEKHYYDASRRSLDELVAVKDEEDFKNMLPDAVSCVVILEIPDKEPTLLLSYEYRYPAGRFLLGVPAGLLDPEDRYEENPLIATAIREIHEETGIVANLNRDSFSVINPLLFSSPGITDESNALVLAVIRLSDTAELTQAGAVGQECFDGFVFVTKEKAKEILKNGRDDNGHAYSVFTWMALTYFAADLWK